MIAKIECRALRVTPLRTKRLVIGICACLGACDLVDWASRSKMCETQLPLPEEFDEPWFGPLRSPCGARVRGTGSAGDHLHPDGFGGQLDGLKKGSTIATVN